MKRLLHNATSRLFILGICLVFMHACSGSSTSGSGSDTESSSVFPADLTIISITPADDATGVAIDNPVQIKFSRNMDHNSFDSDNFNIKEDDLLIPGDIVINGISAFIYPYLDLSYNTTYTGYISGFVQDTEGQFLSTGVTWSFTTMAVPDVISPTNSSTNFINNGDVFSTSNTVTISLSATDDVGITGYYLSQYSTTPEASGSGWTTVTATKSYSADVSFSINSDYGLKTLYCWFKDAAGNVSSVASDTINTVSSSIREVNYYPRNYAWHEFWTNWEDASADMDTDLATLKDMGVNVVRIFLLPDDFGFPVPNTTYLEYFEEALQLITSHGMRAHVNLFDCWYDYTEISNSKYWLDLITYGHKNDTRIAVWELENESLIDNAQVQTWVSELLPYLKQSVGDSWVTLSVNDLTLLQTFYTLTQDNPPDIYNYHWYPEGGFEWTYYMSDALDDALTIVSGGTLLIGEFGYSTYLYAESAQADLYSDFLYQTQAKGIDHTGFWTFTDFPENTAQCDGVVPADKNQFYFGVYDETGTAKEAVDYIQDAWLDDSWPDEMVTARLHNTSFEDKTTEDTLYSWITWDEDWTETQYYTQDCTRSKSGGCSLKLTAEAGKFTGFYSVPSLNVESGKTYNISVYVQTQDLNGFARIAFSWYSYDYGTATETWISLSNSAQVTTADLGTWTQITLNNVTPPANADLFLVFGQLFSNDADSIVWFDDCSITSQ